MECLKGWRIEPLVIRHDMDSLPANDISYGTRVMSPNHSNDFVDGIVAFTNKSEAEANNEALIALYTAEDSAKPVTLIAIYWS